MAVSPVVGVGIAVGCRTLGRCPEIWGVIWLEETACTSVPEALGVNAVHQHLVLLGFIFHLSHSHSLTLRREILLAPNLTESLPIPAPNEVVKLSQSLAKALRCLMGHCKGLS